MTVRGGNPLLGSYTRGEIVALLSLTRDQAIDLDAVPQCSLAGLSGAQKTARKRAEDVSLPVIARWQDVQRAKGRVTRHKEGLAMAQLVAGGYSERELGRLTGRGRMAVRRRWHASIDEILDFLGGPASDESGVSRVDLCVTCGEAPRVRLAATYTRGKGGKKVKEPERDAAVCESCLKPELHFRILRKSMAVAA